LTVECRVLSLQIGVIPSINITLLYQVTNGISKIHTQGRFLDVRYCISHNLGPFISDVWNYVPNPSLNSGLMVVVFIIGMVAFARFTFYLLMRPCGLLKGEQKETSVDVFSHSNLPSLDEIFF
jgi:hypothetical protein